MNDVVAWSFVVLLVCAMCSLFYWNVVYPVMLKALQFRLFARRDEVRRNIIELGQESFSHRYVEGFICKGISVVPSIPLFAFAKYSMTHKINKPSEAIEQFNREASDELRDMKHLTLRDCILIMMINSPITFFCVAVLVFFLWVGGKLAKFYQRTENFVGDLPDLRMPQPDSRTPQMV